MASDYYTPPTANVDGETADAADVNVVSEAVLTAFELLEAYLDSTLGTVDNWSTLAQGWAETAEDVVVPTQPAGSYSALHYSAKAADSASAAATSETNAAASAASLTGAVAQAQAAANAASTSASQASTSATNAATSAANASTSETNAATSETNASDSETAALAAQAAAETAETNAAASAAAAAESEANVAAAVAGLPSTTIAEGTGIDLAVAGGVTTISADRAIAVVAVERTTDCAVGTKVDIIVPSILDGLSLTSIDGGVNTAGTTGTMTVNVEKGGTDMLSTALTFASGATADNGAEVIKSDGTETVATGDILEVEIVAVHTAAAKGLYITMVFSV
jgi:hypothetical protein